MSNEYPSMSRVKKVIIKSEEERMREGEVVRQMMKKTEYMP